MRSLTSFINIETSLVAGSESRKTADTVRAAIATALRLPETLDGILAHLRIPSVLRPLVRPYVRRAIEAVADWISPDAKDPA